MTSIDLTPEGESLVGRLDPHRFPFSVKRIWNPSPSAAHRTEPYDVPHAFDIGIFGNEETASRFSPPPFAVIVEGGEKRAVILLVADAGWHVWNNAVFEATSDGAVIVRVDLEGRTPPEAASRHVRVQMVEGTGGESRVGLLRRGLTQAYPDAAAVRAPIPAWWLRPIYCGWGDQVATSLWLEGPGPERRALAYCTQGLYARWIDRLEAAGVPVGTIIIDHGWSPAGVWIPDEIRWPDLRGFVSAQHDRGRRVLLWIATWLWDGLPDEWCVFRDGVKLVADPTHPDYREFVRERVHRLLSPEGIGADGFKIDQLAYSPSTRRPRGGPRFGWTSYYPPSEPPLKLYGEGWGCELLYGLQKTMYDAAKSAKADALVTSSTVHPYFRDTFDMTRLHDTGVVSGDVIDAMRIRADLSRAALPGKPIDADDWVYGEYEQWMKYTIRGHELGVPCIFYSERFVKRFDGLPTTVPIPDRDLGRIARAWRGK